MESGKYLGKRALLKWKMKTGYEQFKTRADRKKKWEDLLAKMEDDEWNDANDETSRSWDPVVLEHSNLEYSKEPDRSKVDQNEHVDENENFDVDDVPLHDYDLKRLLDYKNACMASIKKENKDTLAPLNKMESKQFLNNEWSEIWT